MEIPYLLNNSPDFFGEQPHGLHYAGYSLNGVDVDGESGPFGTVRVHDDYWAIDDEDKEYYNFNIRNQEELTSREYLPLVKHFTGKYKNIALLLHATNIEELCSWYGEYPVFIVSAHMGNWDSNLEYWAMREFNDIMSDEANANYSTETHEFKDLNYVLDRFEHRINADLDWRSRCSAWAHYSLGQHIWCSESELYNVYNGCRVMQPSAEWMSGYYADLQSKQEYNVPALIQLREAWTKRRVLYGRP